MFNLRNKKSSNKMMQSKIEDKVAMRIVKILLLTQNMFVKIFNKIFNKQTTKIKKISFAIFCLVFGGISILSFIGAFTHNASPALGLKPGHLQIPKYLNQVDFEITPPSINAKDTLRIKYFRNYMDSLGRHPQTVNLYDSILKLRPGLSDSIRLMEQLFLSPAK